MKWINVELGYKWHPEDPDNTYRLILEIINDWEALSKELYYKVHETKKPEFKDFRFYTDHIIHDGNRSEGLLLSYKHMFERDGKLEKGLTGWNPCQSLLEHIRNGEILLDYFNLREQK